MPSIRSTLLAALLLSLSSLAWAGNIVLGRAVHASFPPVGLSFWRWLVALLVLAAVTLPALRAHWPAVRRGWRQLLLLALCGMAIFHTFLYLAVNHTTAVNAALVMATSPVIVPFLAWAVLGDRPSPRMALGTLISLAGVVFIVARGHLERLLELQVNVGDLLLLVSVVSWSLYTVLLKRRPSGVPPQVMLTVCVAWTVVLLLPVYLAEHALFRPVPITWEGAATVAYVALIASVLAFLSFNKGIEMLGPSKGGLFMHLIPVFATLLAILFLGERLHSYHLFGIAAIIAGIALSTTARGTQPAGVTGSTA